MNEIIQRVVNLYSHKPKITYKLGADSVEETNTPQLDCSAFMWRCMGERKYDSVKHVWRNTSWIWNDIQNEETKFEKVHELKDIQQGDVIVYGWEKGKAGHIAIINSVDDKGNIRGYDCSSSRNGIEFRLLNFFLKRNYVVGRYKKTLQA